jgi:hypothetical protein
MEKAHYLAENSLLLWEDTTSHAERFITNMKSFLESTDLTVLTEEDKTSKAKELIKEIDEFLSKNKGKAKTAKVLSLGFYFIGLAAMLLPFLTGGAVFVLLSAKALDIIFWVSMSSSILSSLQLGKLREKAIKMDNRLVRVSKKDLSDAEEKEVQKLRDGLKKIYKRK